MIYEDALKLQKAGFPQIGGRGDTYTPRTVIIRDGKRVNVETSCYAPTLDELIEFCDFGWLKIHHKGVEGGWIAFKGKEDGVFGEGKTIDAALVDLYSKIHV